MTAAREAPPRRTRAPARDPSATRPCTDAAASPASTGASSAHSSTVLPPASVSSSPCGGSSRWRLGLHRGEHLVDVGGVERGGRIESQARRVVPEDPVNHQGMDMNV